MVSRQTARALAFTDGVLVYCPRCVEELNLLSDDVMPPNWLPFGPILERDDLPEKRCERCEAYFDEDADGTLNAARCRKR